MSGITLIYDERAYSVVAIQKAAYRLLNHIIVDISFLESQIICLLQPTPKTSVEGFDHYVIEFKKEILDQQLRLKIKAETEDLRNLILGIAFSKTGFQASE